MKTTQADTWSHICQPCDIDLKVIKWRSAWPLFHAAVILPYSLKGFLGLVILPYIYKIISCINCILSDYESVWPQNKCRSQWPTFHGPLIMPYILKSIWCINIILLDYESVWPKIGLQNKCRSQWPIFRSPVNLPDILKSIRYINIIYLWIMSQYDPKFGLKINVGHSDLHFRVW